MDIEVTFCVVNTQQRELLERCLDAIARERASVPFGTEVIVLDNASTDGSTGVARHHPTVDSVIALKQRRGKGENDTALLQAARGRYALLLNEDSELLPGATADLHAALEANPRAGTAGAALLAPDGRTRTPSAWRFPSVFTAAAGALFLHKLTTVQSRGDTVRPVDWAQSAALMVRRIAAEEVGWFDPLFFVYSDEVDFCKRLADAGWHTVYVPQARAIHHEQLSTGSVPGRRIIELSRNRDRYMRKHHTRLTAAIVRWLTAWTYLVRSLVAIVLPGHDPARYRAHVHATLHPGEGDGLREAALDYNRGGMRL